MAEHTTLINYTVAREGVVESVTVRDTAQTDKYPSGWDYSLHLSTLGGVHLIRYDNAHEATKGHELHTTAAEYEVEFPGMWVLLARFYAEANAVWSIVGYDPSDVRPL